MKQMALVVSNLIRELERVKSDLYHTEFALHSYISYNKDESKFKKFMEKILGEQREKIAKDRAESSVRDDKQQVVSESK